MQSLLLCCVLAVDRRWAANPTVEEITATGNVIVGTLGTSANPLHAAARNGQADAVVKLLADGADVNALDEGANTPLHEACVMGRTEMASLLVAANAAVNKANDYGATPLIVSSQSGQVRV